MLKLFKSIIISIIVTVLLSSSNSTFSQSFSSIRGAVVDAQSGLPLENVNVFLSYTMIGAATDKDGYFWIPKIPEGRFELVVSHVGYKIQTRSISVFGKEELKYKFYLESKVYQLSPITIHGKDDKEWQENLAIFTKCLLGETENAKLTEILNPLVLNFSENESGALIAEHSEPLIIKNHALGYQIIYVLKYFEATSFYTKYSGNPKFEAIEPDSEYQMKQWEINRIKAYQGSLRHFLTSICENYKQSEGSKDEPEFEVNLNDINERGAKIDYKEDDYLKRQGFHVLYMSNLWLTYRPIAKLVNLNQYLIISDHATEMYLKFPNFLQVTYTQEYPVFSPRDSRKEKGQISWITLEKDSVVIDIYGRYFETFMIKMSGHWAMERLADMVPYEYALPPKEKIKNKKKKEKE